MKKRALIVAINKYKQVNWLEGCVNDALDYRQLLVEKYQFNPDDIRVLTDERATKMEIIDRLGWLGRGLVEKDKAVFIDSSHGATCRDEDGDELRDHLDEALVPYDFDMTHTSGLIKDDDLAKIFKGYPKGVELTCIFDACHSGDSTKGMTPVRMRTKGIRLPIDLELSHRSSLNTRRIGRKSTSDWLKVDQTMGHLLLAACRDTETASDTAFGPPPGRPNGAFSYCLMKSLKAGDGRTWLQVMEDARKLLKDNGFSQTPQLEGPATLINGYPFGGI